MSLEMGNVTKHAIMQNANSMEVIVKKERTEKLLVHKCCLVCAQLIQGVLSTVFVYVCIHMYSCL